MPHARRGPLPSLAARARGRRPRSVGGLSPRRAPDGRGPRPRSRRGWDVRWGVGPGRRRRAGPRRRARPARVAARLGARVVAAAPVRAPPPGIPRLARRPREGGAAHRRARTRRGRGRVRAAAPDRLVVARGGRRVLRRAGGDRLRSAGLDRPALLPAHAARGRDSTTAAAPPRGPSRRPRTRCPSGRPVASQPDGERGGRRLPRHATHHPLRHPALELHPGRDRVRAGPRTRPPRPRRPAPRPRGAGRPHGGHVLAGGPAPARRRRDVRPRGPGRPGGDGLARAGPAPPGPRRAPARQWLFAPDRARGRRLRPRRHRQPRGVHRRDGAALCPEPRRAPPEPMEGARPVLAPRARPSDRARQRRARMTPRRTLRTLVEKKQGLVVPGAYDGISARLVQQAGFPAVYMTGYGTAASRLGLPDLGFAGLAEMADHARNIAAVVDIPLIADADTGYGNALNVRRTVQTYEAAGVAALHIEDQITPKRCGHLSGHQVIPRAEFAGKIRAAVEARRDPDLLVIARTDGSPAVGFDEALRRGEAATKAGADVLFIEAPRTEAQVEQVARAFDTPLLYNYAPGGRSPLLPFARLRALGFAIILLPVDTLLVGVRAIAEFLAEVRRRDDVLSLSDRYMPFGEFNRLIGVMDQMAMADRYKGDG